jgi:hypothetical protein
VVRDTILAFIPTAEKRRLMAWPPHFPSQLHPISAAKSMSEESLRQTRLTANEVTMLSAKNPGLPADYVNYLVFRGWGELPGGPMLYSGPVAPADIFGARSDRLPAGIILFGDDFAGTSFGFDVTNGWSIVAINSVDLRVSRETVSFTEFLQKYEDSRA